MSYPYILETKNREYCLNAIEAAGLSYVPFGAVDGEEKPLFSFRHLWGEKRRVRLQDFGKVTWNMSKMGGIQVFTGHPTYHRIGKKDYLHLVDIDIERLMVDQYKEHVKSIGSIYRDNIEGNACITKTKSRGYRLSAFSEYLDTKYSFQCNDGMLLEIFSIHGMSKYDRRYEIVEGCLLEIPTIPKTVLQEIYKVAGKIGTIAHVQKERKIVGSSQLNDLQMDWHEKSYGKCKVHESQLFRTEHCRMTGHLSNREEVRFTRYENGSIDGICFNCGERWWERTARRLV